MEAGDVLEYMEAPVQVRKLHLQFGFCSGSTLLWPQVCGMCTLKLVVWVRFCVGQGWEAALAVISADHGTSESHWHLPQSSPTLFSLKCAEAAFWFSASDKGSGLWPENLSLMSVGDRKMINKQVLWGRKGRHINKQCSRKQENKNQHIKYSIEICTNRERKKTHLQGEVLTLHTTSSDNILSSNLKEFPKNLFPCKSKLNVLWNYIAYYC